VATIEYNQVLVGNIDITDTYKKLMQASTGQGSAYLKAKETINDSLSSMVGLSDNDRGKILSDTISSIAKEITVSAMEMALKIEMENRDAPYALTKLKADTMLASAQVYKIGADIDIAKQELTNQTTAGWIAQATAYRDYGVQTWNMSAGEQIVPATAYTDYGIKVQTIKKATADTYMSYASSYRKDGNVTFTTNPDGSFNTVNGDLSGLTYYQTGVAKRQIKGFEDNMRQHVVNSSASMVSMLLTANVPGIDYAPYLSQYSNAAAYLSTTTA
jgi:CheY-specific phosphatase CheX